MNSKAKEIVLDALDKMQTVEGSKGVIILYKGKQLIMGSGKRIWSHRRHASAALSHHLREINWGRWNHPDGYIDYKTVIKELEKEGLIEFKELK